MDRYTFLLENWDRDLALFFDFIETVCGIGKDNQTYTLLKNEIHTISDLTNWIECFDGDFDSVEFTTNEFMNRKKYMNFNLG
jgi:hypothetical protein